MAKTPLLWGGLASILVLLPMAAITAAPISERSQAIDNELKQLEQELDYYRLQVMDAEMESQALMLDDWERYSQKLEEMEKNEEMVKKLEQRILQLKKEKQSLSK